MFSVKCKWSSCGIKATDITGCSVGKPCQEHLGSIVHLILNLFLDLVHTETYYCCQVSHTQFEKLWLGDCLSVQAQLFRKHKGSRLDAVS